MEQSFDVEVKKAKNKGSFAKFIKVLFFIIFLPVIILFYIIKGVVKLVKRKRKKKEIKRGKLLLISSDISDIDIMKGEEFENYLATLFFYEGYKTEVTQKSKDYGADLILYKDEQKIIVQAKRYNKQVGIKSVQEIIGAKRHYQATEGLVVTNSYFSSEAETIAKENNIRLIDRDELIEIYTNLKEKLKISIKESDLVDKKDLDINKRFPNMI